MRHSLFTGGLITGLVLWGCSGGAGPTSTPKVVASPAKAASPSERLPMATRTAAVKPRVKRVQRLHAVRKGMATGVRTFRSAAGSTVSRPAPTSMVDKKASSAVPFDGKIIALVHTANLIGEIEPCG